jgi:hypothetical protein
VDTEDAEESQIETQALPTTRRRLPGQSMADLQRHCFAAEVLTGGIVELS